MTRGYFDYNFCTTIARGNMIENDIVFFAFIIRGPIVSKPILGCVQFLWVILLVLNWSANL